MAKMQRSKGARGEREVAAIISDLLGYKVSRRCRQHDGDCDLEGVPGWSLEVKNQAHVSRALLKAWWQQAVDQASDELCPALWYKRAPGWWRVIWGHDGSTDWLSLHEGEPEAWAAYVREGLPERGTATQEALEGADPYQGSGSPSKRLKSPTGEAQP
jgi:hypothetical protein